MAAGRAARRAGDARTVPVRPLGRRAPALPADTGAAARGTWHRPGPAAAAAAGTDPAGPGGSARVADIRDGLVPEQGTAQRPARLHRPGQRDRAAAGHAAGP